MNKEQLIENLMLISASADAIREVEEYLSMEKLTCHGLAHAIHVLAKNIDEIAYKTVEEISFEQVEE